MRWVVAFILVYLLLALQHLLRVVVGLDAWTPDLVLLLVLMFALHASARDALILAFAAGLLSDVMGSGPPGLMAFGYGLSVLAIRPLRHLVYREHPITRSATALLAGMVVLVWLALRGWLSGEGFPGAGAKALSLALTALLAPIGVAVLWRLRRSLRVRDQIDH
jgi:rod shape-determining protein MreD